MGSRARQWIRAGLVAMLAGPVLAAEPPAGPLIAIEDYGAGPMEFAIGERASITVHYRADLDPERVRVRMNGRPASRMLDPVAGGAETVPLYLENGENRLVLEASSTAHPGGEEPEVHREYRFIERLEAVYGADPGGSSGQGSF